MEYLKREDHHDGNGSAITRFTINFSNGVPPNLSNLLKTHKQSFSSSKVAVSVSTTGCTGAAGSFALATSDQGTGTPNVPLGVSIPVAPTGYNAVGADTEIYFGLQYIVLDASGVTWPTNNEGLMVITITTKI